MSKQIMTQGATDVSVMVKIRDSSLSTNEGLDGLVFNSSGLTAYYYRPGAATATQITLATLASLSTAHADGGFLEINATNMPGWYRLDLPDAMFTSGVDTVGLCLRGAANMDQVDAEIQISGFDLSSTSPDVNVVQWNGSATASNDTAIATAPTNFADLSISASNGYVELLAATQASIDAIEIDTSTTLQAELDAIQAAVITNAAGADIAADIIAIKADTAAVLIDTADMQPKIGTPATDVSADIAAVKAETALIVADTNELQTDDVPSLIAALNDLASSDIQTVIENNHLDHFFATDYDPSSKPGVATALLNELVENDGGVSRFTANALEQAPTGGSAPSAATIADAVWDEAKATHVAAGSFGEEVQTHSTFDATSDDVATVTTLTGHTPQTGDTYALANGASGFVVLLAGINAIVADTNELQTDDIPGLIAALNDLSTADIDARLAAIGLDHLLSVAVTGADVADNSLFAKLVSSAATADWDTFNNTDDSLQAFGDRVFSVKNVTDSLPDGGALTTIDNNIDAILADTNELQTDDVPSLIATAQADLDIITGPDGVNLLTATQASIDAIETDTGTTLQSELDAIQAAVIDNAAGVDIAADIAALNDISVSDVLTTQMTESYASDGVAPTLAQALSLIQQSIGDFSISGTTLTVKQLDGSTTAATYTLDDASDPTSRTRAT